MDHSTALDVIRVDSEEAESSIWIHASETAILRMEWLWRNHLRKIYLEEFTEPH